MTAGASPPPPRRETVPAKDEIARKAYFIYLAEGRPQGQDARNWFAAEAELTRALHLGRRQLAPKM
jgi:hypothetical protein